MLGGADERGVDELQDGALAQKHAGHLGAPACLIALDFPAVGAACERTLQLGRAWPQARDYLGGRLRLLATPASGAQTSSRNHSVFALPPRVRRNRHSQTGSTRPRRRLGQQSGFTLLELLVALVVLGFLVVGLTQGIRTGLAMWGAQTRRLSETAELDAGARVLRMLLTNMTALSPGNVGTGAATPNAATSNIGASSDKLTFVGDLPTGLGTTRRANITLELNQERLVLRWTPRRHERTTAPEPEPIETELIRGVERLEFAYWGAASPDQPASWQDQWGSPQFPELIRVRLTFSKGHRRRWPNLIVAPSASASPQATGQFQRQRRPGELKAGSSYQR